MSSVPDSRPRILIVEDDDINFEILAAALGDGCRMSRAADGAAALSMARAAPPDLILLDLMLPKKNGFEVCKELKAEQGTANVPVIFVTGMTDKVNEAVGLRLGAVDYIYKPFDRDVVLARVGIHLRLKLQSDFLKRLVEQRTQDLELLRSQARALLD